MKLSPHTTRKRDSLRHEYAGLARVYDQRWAFYIAATTRETLARTKILTGDTVLDVGCGTGILLRQLARRFPTTELVGLDPVPEMLEVARRRFGASVPLIEGCAEKLPFARGVFDVVVSCSALHHFRSPWTAVGEIARVLRPGGRVVITDWRRDYWTTPFIQTLLQMQRKGYCRTLRSRELRVLFEDAGFMDIAVSRYRINWQWGLMTGTATKPEA